MWEDKFLNFVELFWTNYEFLWAKKIICPLERGILDPRCHINKKKTSTPIKVYKQFKEISKKLKKIQKNHTIQNYWYIVWKKILNLFGIFGHLLWIFLERWNLRCHLEIKYPSPWYKCLYIIQAKLEKISNIQYSITFTYMWRKISENGHQDSYTPIFETSKICIHMLKVVWMWCVCVWVLLLNVISITHAHTCTYIRTQSFQHTQTWTHLGH